MNTNNKETAESRTKPVIRIWDFVKRTYKLVFTSPWAVLAIVLILGTVNLAHEILSESLLMNVVAANGNGEAIYSLCCVKAFHSCVNLFPLTLIFYIGVQKVFLTKLHEGSTSVSKLFTPFKRFFAIIGAAILLYGAIYLISIIMFFVYGMITSSEIQALNILAIIVGAVAFIYMALKIIAFSFFGLLLVEDNKLGPIAALKKSPSICMGFCLGYYCGKHCFDVNTNSNWYGSLWHASIICW